MELTQNVLHFGTVRTENDILSFSGLSRLPLNSTTTKAPITKKKVSDIMVFVPNMIMKKAPNTRVLEPDEIQE